MKRTLIHLLALVTLSLPSAAQARPLHQEALTVPQVLSVTEAVSVTAENGGEPATSTAAESAPAETTAAPQAEQLPSAPGMQFKLAQEGGRYVVYFRPTATPEQPGLLMTAQVTVRVPHGTGADRFEATDIQSGAAGANWAVTSRIDAPAEAPAFDILSFEFDYESSNFAAYTWQAGQAVAAFSFANSGSYQGPLGLLQNCDAFMYNSSNLNPGNQIAILGLNNDNAFLGDYESAVAATCSANSVFLPVTLR